MSDKCLEKPTGKGSLNQPMGPAVLVQCRNPPVLTQMFVMDREKGESEEGAPIATDESVCLDAPERDDTVRTPRVRVIACSGYARQAWRRNVEVKLYNYSI